MSRRAGNAATELAFALPVLLLLGAGVAEWGWWFRWEVTVAQIARDAALTASITAARDDPAGAAEARARAALLAAGLPTGNAIVLAETTPTTAGPAMRVLVSAPYRGLVPLIPSPARLSADATFRLQDP